MYVYLFFKHLRLLPGFCFSVVVCLKVLSESVDSEHVMSPRCLEHMDS